jgi:UPF0755 protein
MFRWLSGVSLLLVAAVVGSGWWWLQHPLPLAADRVEVSIEPGMTPRDAAQAWVDAGVRTHPRLLYEWFRWSGDARRIRAGSYEIERGATPRTVLQTMVQGAQTMQTVRVIEGWTFAQLRAELAKAPGLRPTTATMSEAALMTALGAPGVAPEGRFFPDTYAYGKGVSDITVMRRAYEQMQRRLDAAWQQRAPDTPLKSAEEALILASIVEKETGAESERSRVAAVFSNRLRIGMPLQTDPTVIYGMGARFDGNLRKADLQADGPYNTYMRAGLPPTPIALPGNAALLAAVRPASTKVLYFVSRGDGSSEFSDNLDAHNRAVNKYQRGR